MLHRSDGRQTIEMVALEFTGPTPFRTRGRNVRPMEFKTS
jgi:hypothetical protein